MFICRDCTPVKRQYDDYFNIYLTSHGPCEVCHKTRVCADIKSAQLLPPPPPSPELQPPRAPVPPRDREVS